MKLNTRNEKPDERDVVLGSILRNAVEAAAGQCPPGFPAHAGVSRSERRYESGRASRNRLRRWHLPRLAAAAAVVMFIGGTMAAGFGIAGHTLVRSSSLELARSIMPERSLWVPEAMSGEGAPAGAIADFVEGLWSSGNGADALWPVF